MSVNQQKSSRKDKAICALLNAPTVSEAAKAAGVVERTLYRWLREDSNFIETYKEARRETIRQATARLQQACSTAVDTLLDVMQDDGAKDMARVNAAKSVLELALKAVELEDLAERVNALEMRLEDSVDA
ncbi:MAG: hypothetical protein ABFD49_05370 [Armatimonadota bacterium]|nr:hypothetical protein [bacterium]